MSRGWDEEAWDDWHDVMGKPRPRGVESDVYDREAGDVITG